MTGMTKFFNIDCLEYMRESVLDSSVKLIVTDPPYGISFEGLQVIRRGTISTTKHS